MCPFMLCKNSCARGGLFSVSCLVFWFQLISRHIRQLCYRTRGHHKLLCMKHGVQHTDHSRIRLSIGQGHWTENHHEKRDAASSETGFLSRATGFHPHRWLLAQFGTELPASGKDREELLGKTENHAFIDCINPYSCIPQLPTDFVCETSSTPP